MCVCLLFHGPQFFPHTYISILLFPCLCSLWTPIPIPIPKWWLVTACIMFLSTFVRAYVWTQSWMVGRLGWLIRDCLRVTCRLSVSSHLDFLGRTSPYILLRLTFPLHTSLSLFLPYCSLFVSVPFPHCVLNLNVSLEPKPNDKDQAILWKEEGEKQHTVSYCCHNNLNGQLPFVIMGFVVFQFFVLQLMHSAYTCHGVRNHGALWEHFILSTSAAQVRSHNIASIYSSVFASVFL
jgi:hypothetical protein